jgi:glutamate-5-semialdehyde dehydrogenase
VIAESGSVHRQVGERYPLAIMIDDLTTLEAGMPVVFGGNRIARVSPDLAAAFQPGDRLVVVQDTGALLHIPQADHDIATGAVDAAVNAFAHMGTTADHQISAFYHAFADRLEDDVSFAPIATANAEDVARGKASGRSTTRLVLSDVMRRGMVDGLRMWAESPSGRGAVVETAEHTGWRVELVRAGIGVVGFVFEGRPNVFADATGVIRNGNTVVFRIGSAALATAQAIVTYALDPAIRESVLPPGAVSLVGSREHAAGWAMFADSRLALAVARGSGIGVSQLGAVARQAGTPVSLHGTGGAWIVAADSADGDAFAAAVYHSLDRKVCNTLNTCAVVESRADDLIPRFLEALDKAGQRRGAISKLHVAEGDAHRLPASWFEKVEISRANGLVLEPRAEPIAITDLGFEWEWEESPEVTLLVVPNVGAAVSSFNQQSPRLAASLISGDDAEQARFWEMIDAPFVGNGFTRWVDGQYALDRPELGLSNWQGGRLFGRGGILSGDSVFTIRTRATQDDMHIGR